MTNKKTASAGTLTATAPDGAERNHMNYSTSNMKKRVPMILALMALMIALILNIAVPETVTYGVEFPMANANMQWAYTSDKSQP